LSAVDEHERRLGQFPEAEGGDGFGQFAFLAPEHDFAFECFVFVLQFFQFFIGPAEVPGDLVGVMAVVDIDDGERGEEEEEADVADDPAIAQPGGLPAGASGTAGFWRGR
jgi:hypothetical protein